MCDYQSLFCGNRHICISQGYTAHCIISYTKLIQCLMSKYHVGVLEGLLMVFLATPAPIATKLGFDNLYFPVVTLRDMYLKILYNLH